MKFPVFGASDDAPANNATRYIQVNNAFVTNWNATESAMQVPISENMTITDFKVIVDTAPGAGKSRAFTVRQNGADTGVTVTISDTNTSATFSGSVSFNAGDLLTISSVPTSLPTAPGNIYWHMEWNTTGSVYLLLGGAGSATNSATNYHNVFGGGAAAWSGSVSAADIPVPTGATVTKLQVASPDGAPGAGTSYAVSMRLNNTTDICTATISDTNTSASASGSQALAAGDVITLKEVPTGTPTSRRLAWCFSLTMTTDGESFYGYGTNVATPTTGTNYEQALGYGLNSWTTTESTHLMRVPACDIKKLYVRLSAASGVGSDRAYMIRQNSANTTLTTTLSNTTTGNDTTHTVTLAGDDTIDIQMIPNAVPPAAANSHVSYVLVTAQPAAPTATSPTLLLMGV